MGAAPIHFLCPVLRRQRNWAWADVRPEGPAMHVITLTGRKRPNPSHARGRRTSSEEREYICSCGHEGWSRHKDLERMEARR